MSKQQLVFNRIVRTVRLTRLLGFGVVYTLLIAAISMAFGYANSYLASYAACMVMVYYYLHLKIDLLPKTVAEFIKSLTITN